jgi:hypothetical protein
VPAATNLTLGCSFKAKLAEASGLMSLGSLRPIFALDFSGKTNREI